MGFHKTYPNRKDWRRPYQGSRKICAKRDGCNICLKGRLHQTAKADVSELEQVDEWRRREQIAEEEYEAEICRNDPEQYEEDLVALFHPAVSWHGWHC